MYQIMNTILKLENKEKLPANYTGIIQKQNHRIWFYADRLCVSLWDEDNSDTEEDAKWDEAWYFKSLLHRMEGTAYNSDSGKLWCLLNMNITANSVILIIF